MDQPPMEDWTMYECNLLIGGADRAAAGGATFNRIDPVSGEVATRAAAATVADAQAAAEAARAAAPAWAAQPPAARRALLLKAADVLEAKAPEFIARGVAEAGGAPGWYGFNVMLAASMLREAASMTTQVTGETIPSNVPGCFAMSLRQPVGVVLGIAPWNAPLILGVRAIAMPLACGNSVVLKASETCPALHRPVGVVLGIAPWNAPLILGVRAIAMPLACGNSVVLKASETCPALHRLIGTVFEEAGFPAGVVNVVTNAPDDAPAVVEALIAHDAVRRVNFTGSTHVGRIIAQMAARHLKPVLLELGGKNPLVILHDADLDEAVQAAAFAAFFNQGQICMCTDRIIIDRRIADAFVDKLASKARTLAAGTPGAEGAVLAAMVDARAAERVRGLVDDAVAKGARLPLGPLQIDGAIMQPVMLDGVTAEMRFYAEESFGPVVGIERFDDEAEALRLANDSEYGLSAAVFSRDVARALEFAKRVESGICHVNSSTVADEAQMPFGGVKASGYGRFGGKAAIDAFTELRWITLQTTPRHYPV
ncbi:MAG: aldehyde dehydrogenase [Rhodocyclaceae bacterium]